MVGLSFKVWIAVFDDANYALDMIFRNIERIKNLDDEIDLIIVYNF